MSATETLVATDDIARVCHEANRAYCASLGDFSQPSWDDAPTWQRESAINGVRAHLKSDLMPRESHELWLKEKADAGWSYGAVKDAVKKVHPCFVPYDELPEAQKRKDSLFSAIVAALK
jgi:hypothetical protein